MKNEVPVNLFEVSSTLILEYFVFIYVLQKLQPYIKVIFNHLREEPFKKFLERYVNLI